MEQADKLAALRAVLKENGVDGFLIPKADEHQGEYIPARAERLEWLTGFTGSGGQAVVLADKAMVQTDSRYELQIAKQVDAARYELTQDTQIDFAEWIAQNAAPRSVIGYDPTLHTPNQIAHLEMTVRDKFITLKALDHNPIDALWHDQPAAPASAVESFSEAVAGRSARDKREMIGKKVADAGCAATVLTLPDSIAWLLNIRGTDVPHIPLALSNAIVYRDGTVDWFIAPDRVSPDLRANLGNSVAIHAPETFRVALDTLGQKKETILLDYRKVPMQVKKTLDDSGAKTKDGEDPCILPKACKTPEEQQAIRNAHLRDGVAVTKFLYWLDHDGSKQTLNELDIADKLESFRRAESGYRDSSFDTIAGWGPNGAIVHYRATPEDHATITPPGLLLLDSGAQYNDGTTDITRTIAIGKPTDEMKRAFTLVLKGHIGIAMLTFPDGTKGSDIDVLARKALWAQGMDYGHGTGHGVGCYLSVHEEGGGISSRAARPFKPGMVVSNEPGYYKTGAFGIRIENLILVKEAGLIGNGRKALAFETLTLVPIDRHLIDKTLLTHEETAWLDDYHARVAQALGPHLDPAQRTWLQEATAPLKKKKATAPNPGPWPYPKSPGPL